MSKPSARQPAVSGAGYVTSWKRCALAALLVLVGIAWIVVFIQVAKDAWAFDPSFGGEKPSNPLPFMAKLGLWNYLIGFGLICAGLIAAAHPSTPLGRGRGVVATMLFCFLFGLVYIVAFYFLGNNLTKVPVMGDLNQYNLLVGIGFMAVGFSYATKWE